MQWSDSRLVIGVAGLVLASLVLVVWLLRGRWKRFGRRAETQRALDRFRLEREQLEAKFFDLARTRGKPRGVRWVNCAWLDRATFARSIDDGMLTAFVGVNISFEAIEGSDMEEVEAVGMVRDASALFHFHNGHWGTGGRALFNMDPQDALQRLEGQFEPITVDSTAN